MCAVETIRSKDIPRYLVNKCQVPKLFYGVFISPECDCSKTIETRNVNVNINKVYKYECSFIEMPAYSHAIYLTHTMEFGIDEKKKQKEIVVYCLPAESFQTSEHIR